MLLSELNLLPLKVFGGGSVYSFGTRLLQHHLTLFIVEHVPWPPRLCQPQVTPRIVHLVVCPVAVLLQI